MFENGYTQDLQDNIIAAIDSVTLAVGSQETDLIESAMADLVTIKEFATGIGAIMQALQDDLTTANARALQLQQANNQVMRQLFVQKEETEKSINEISKTQQIANLIL